MAERTTRIRKVLLAIVAAVLLVGIAVWGYFAFTAPPICDAAQGLPVLDGTWSKGASMPTARSEVAAAILDGKIYVAGGLAGAGATDAFEVYDTQANTWRKLPPLPTGPLHHAGLAAVGDRIILTGGYTDLAFNAVRSTWAFDPATESWEQLADMPAPLGAHTTEGVGGMLYLFGGAPGGYVTWRYDPATDQWEALSPMPERLEHLGSGPLNEDSILVVGGRWDGQNSHRAIRYSIADDTSTLEPDLPTARGGIGAASLGGVVFVAGGEQFNPMCTFDRVEAFDGSSWFSTPPMPKPRHGLAAVADDETLYVIGGAYKAVGLTLTSATDDLLRFRPHK